MKKIYILALSLSAIALANAQENENHIDEVAIHARSKVIKEREEFKKHAQSTEIISEYEINRNNPAFIEQSLNTMAGVQVEKEPSWVGRELSYGDMEMTRNSTTGD